MYGNHEVEARIDRAMVTADAAARAEMWHQIDSLVMEDVPLAPTVHALETRLFSPRLGGWYHHVTRLLKIDRLYLKQPLALEAPVASGRAARPPHAAGTP